MRNLAGSAALAALAALLVLPSCSGPGVDDAPAATVTGEATGAADGPATAGDRGSAAGFVVDPAANNPVSAIRVQLVRTDSGEAVDSAMTGTDGSYALQVPPASEVPDGTLLQVRPVIPPDHVVAYSYATPTAFPAGVGGTLHHNILLTGP